MLLAHHNSFVMVVNAALGGGDKKGAPSGPIKPGDPGVKDIGAGHATPEAAVAAINAAMTF